MGGIGVPELFILIAPLLIIVMFAGVWKVFEKAGKPGWAAIIPAYGAYTMLKIAGKPDWWIILLFIPLVNVIAQILITLSLAEQFDQSSGFALGMIFLPFIYYPILGFGGAEYKAELTK